MDYRLKKPSREDDLSIYRVPAVDSAARILLLLGNGSREMTLAEIASATGWNKRSVHKILVTLSHHGFLDTGGCDSLCGGAGIQDDKRENAAIRNKCAQAATQLSPMIR